MTMNDPSANASTLGEIERIIAEAREGSLDEADALEAIGRIVTRREAPVETYQKPLG